MDRISSESDTVGSGNEPDNSDSESEAGILMEPRFLDFELARNLREVGGVAAANVINVPMFANNQAAGVGPDAGISDSDASMNTLSSMESEQLNELMQFFEDVGEAQEQDEVNIPAWAMQLMMTWWILYL